VNAQAARDCYAIRDISPHRIAFLSCTRYNYCNLVRPCTVTIAAHADVFTASWFPNEA